MDDLVSLGNDSRGLYHCIIPVTAVGPEITRRQCLTSVGRGKLYSHDFGPRLLLGTKP